MKKKKRKKYITNSDRRLTDIVISSVLRSIFSKIIDKFDEYF